MILPVIVGPTCTGKTSLALEISKKIGSDILSIDSRQVFKYLDIGTGKFKDRAQISKHEGYWEIDGIKVWGYDFLNPNEELNVIKYCDFAKKIIEKYSSENKKLIATCGTGFYLDFLMGKIEFNDISEDRKLELQNLPLEQLRGILHSYENYPKVDENNKPRIITAILSIENKDLVKQKFEIKNCDFRLLNLNFDREILYKNADSFVEEIFQKDVISEYKKVLSDFGKSRILEGLIYKEIELLVNNKISEKEAKELIKYSIHKYIKRQETYFKKFEFLNSINTREEVAEKIYNLI